MGMVPQQQQWQPTRQNPPPQPTTEITTRVQMFNANLLPAPQLPPENIITEQDKQTQIVYENWLNHQNNVLTQQLKYYETEVQKLRKSRKVSCVLRKSRKSVFVCTLLAWFIFCFVWLSTVRNLCLLFVGNFKEFIKECF